MFSRIGKKLLFGYLAIFTSFTVLLLTGTAPPWYSAGLPHRAQTDALLRGELALSDNPADLGLVPMDLCWSEGGVHQVWGVGIPLWRSPFEALARLFGQPAFPDRMALGLFMALIIYMILTTGFRIYPRNSVAFDAAESKVEGILSPAPFLSEKKRGNSKAVGMATPSTGFHRPHQMRKSGKPKSGTGSLVVCIGVVVFCLLFAPLINLLRSPMNHYEEVLVYVHFFGVALACGIFALARRPRWSRFLFLCAVAGLGGLIRPTLVFYGMATIIISSCIMICGEPHSTTDEGLKSSRWPWLLAGVCLFAFGGGVLFLANFLQFGNGWEFGHNLNLSSAIPLLYSKRPTGCILP